MVRQTLFGIITVGVEDTTVRFSVREREIELKSKDSMSTWGFNSQ